MNNSLPDAFVNVFNCAPFTVTSAVGITALSGWIKTKLARITSYCKGLTHFYWQRPNEDIEIHHKHYILNYQHGFDKYKVLFPRRRGPCKFEKILDENGVDVTSEITPFMGPSHNFHGIPTTPCMLGHSELTFILNDGDYIVYRYDENIKTD